MLHLQGSSTTWIMVLAMSTTALIPGSRVSAQQWTIQNSDGPVHWRHCRIVSPSYAGPCGVTFVTQGNKSVNIHFDLDDTGTQGLSFVIPAVDFQSTGTMPFDLVAERFDRNEVFKLVGTCSITPTAIRCISSDGQYSAQAVQRLR